ncbi:hypothetical protein F5883DRAFT_518656 [Diaporthe sp. PMI_573]|nr:hypothetical protein F5883DRAFT_518656 [Diaporthaceae sp. PMI_573]
MAAFSQEAGPEWAYLAPLTKKKGFPFEFDSFIQTLRNNQESPQQSEVPTEDEETSFLAVPKEPQRKPLTFEERVQNDQSYGLSSDLNDPHLEHLHNLYADIAGIDRNKRNPENPDHAYQPPYSTISLPPNQSYPTGWIMGESDKILYYLADKPGLGKTFAAIEAMVRITLIVSNGLTIESERAQLSSLQTRPLHIHDTAHPRFGINEACRAGTFERFGFLCQCDVNTPTYNVTQTGHFSAGYMLVVVPLLLVSQWVENIKRFIRTSVRLPHNQKAIEIVNIHEGENYGEALKSFINGNPGQFGLGKIVIVPATTTIGPSLESLRKEPSRILKTQPSLICWDEIHNIGSTTHGAVEWVRALIYRAKNPTHVLALSGTPWRNGPTDFDVIESIACDKVSFGGWWTNEAYDAYEHRLKNARANLNDSTKQVNQMDIIGRGTRGDVRDEDKTEAHNTLMRHDERLHEYAAQIPLLQRKERSSYLGYYIPNSRPDSEKTELEIGICDSGLNDAQKLVANGYKEFLRVKHRKEVQAWSRKPESTRGPRPKIRSHLFSLDSVATESSRIDVSLVGFAPGLTQHVLERTNTSEVQFRSPEANKVFGKTTTTSQRQAVRTSKYWSMAQSAFLKVVPPNGETQLSPKVVFICNVIDRMLKDREPHAKGQQTFGVFPKKMIIVVPHAFQGLMLISYLFQRYPEHNFTFVGASNETNKERPALLAPFQRSTTSKHPEDGRSTDPIALISTYNIIGVGLNLTRCNYLIVTSPLASKAHQDQQLGRIDRPGQYASVHSYVLVDNGNPVDVTTFYRMQKRTALTVAPDEIGTGLDFLLKDIDEEDEREPDVDDEMGEAN